MGGFPNGPFGRCAGGAGRYGAGVPLFTICFCLLGLALFGAVYWLVAGTVTTLTLLSGILVLAALTAWRDRAARRRL